MYSEHLYLGQYLYPALAPFRTWACCSNAVIELVQTTRSMFQVDRKTITLHPQENIIIVNTETCGRKGFIVADTYPVQSWILEPVFPCFGNSCITGFHHVTGVDNFFRKRGFSCLCLVSGCTCSLSSCFMVIFHCLFVALNVSFLILFLQQHQPIINLPRRATITLMKHDSFQ